MRFILTEDQLEKFKLKLYRFKTEFLNSYVINGTVRKFDSFIVIEDSPVDAFEEPHMEYDYEDGRLYVNKEVRDVFTAMFGDNKEESNDFFKHWFENKFDVTVEFLA